MTVQSEKGPRRWWILGATLVIGIAAGVAIWALTRPQPMDPVQVDSDVETLAAEFVDVDLTWSSEATAIGGFNNVAVFGTDGFFYALSTSPSLREMPQDGSPPPYSIYRSEDGAEWSETPIEGFGTDLWLRNLTESEGNLYVVSTAPGLTDPEGSSVMVGVSTDGGGAWTSASLDLAVRQPTNLGQIFGKSVQPHLAAHGPLVIATGSTRFMVDYNGLVPPGIMTGASFAQRNPTGIEVVNYGESECEGMLCPADASQPAVVWTATWAELGLDPEPDAAVETFVSNDRGLTFSEAANPFGVEHGVDNLFAVGDGVFAFVRPAAFSAVLPQVLGLWRTADGIEWEEAAGFPAMDVVMAFDETGGRLAAIGQLLSTPVIALSDDRGATWRAVDVSSALPTVGLGDSRWITAATIGPLGAFLNIQTWVQNAGVNQQGMQVDQFLASSDLVSWSVTPSTELASGGLYQLLAGADQVLLQGYQRSGGRVTLLGSPQS